MLRLMCPPTYFDIEYSINRWMDVNNKVDRKLASRQWQDFVSVLQELGDEIKFIEAVPGLPDMTFSGDAGIVYNHLFIPSNFRAKERQGEVHHYIRWLHDQGYIIKPIPPHVCFEGLGDIVFQGNRVIIGHGCRSDARAIGYLRKIVPTLKILGDLAIRDDRYFHLAMALSFIGNDTLLYYPPAFDEASIEKLRSMVKYLIPVGDTDANDYFACNNLAIGRTVLLDNCTDALRDALARRGYTARACNMSEFKKSGGSLRCLVLSFIEGPEFSSPH